VRLCVTILYSNSSTKFHKVKTQSFTEFYYSKAFSLQPFLIINYQLSIIMKSIWNPVLNICGLNTPVQMFSSVQKSKVSFELIDTRDNAKIRMMKYNEQTGEPVPSEFIGKGYLKDGLLVPVSSEMIKECTPPASNEIIISKFIDEGDLGYHRPDTFFYLLPHKEYVQNYVLILQSLLETQTIGIGQAVFMNCHTLFALHAFDNKLVLYKLRFNDQLLEIPSPDLSLIRIDPESAVFDSLKRFIITSLSKFDSSIYQNQFNVNFQKQLTIDS
jgi:DNA end-binding protein Ku